MGPGSRPRKILVTHDGGGLPSYSKGLPALPSIRGRSAKGSPCPIRVYALLELVHLDYTSIESTMELNKPPMVKNVLVMTDHFTRYALAVVTKDQMAKTVVKVFYECFIVIFGAPAKLLSDRGGELHVCPGRGVVLCLWYPEVQDHSLPCTVQRAGGVFPSDTILHDWQTIV